MASASLWLLEHKKVGKLGARVTELTSGADFALAAIGQVQGADYAAPNNLTISVLTMDIELTNRGAPSSAAHWMIRYVAPSIDVTVGPMYFTKDAPLNIPMRGQGPDITITKSETIIAMTVDPVAHGKVLSGKLIFHVEHSNAVPVDVPHATITITCEDFTGKKYFTVVNPGPSLTVMK